MEIYGPIKLQGSLADGAGDPVLTKDGTSNEVGTTTNTIGTLTDSYIFVGDASNVPVGVAVSGDITISNAGVVAIASGVIVNADINSTAAIALTKLAATTASRAVVSDGDGFLVPATTTATEIGYVNGVTSAIQTQLDAKQATITGAASTAVSSNFTANTVAIINSSGKLDVSATTDTELGYVAGVTSAIQTQLDAKLEPDLSSVAEGDIIYFNGVDWINLARGTNGQALYSTATSIQWNTPTINGIPVGGSAEQILHKVSGTDFDVAWHTPTLSDIGDVNATAAEVNILSGAIISTTELNYLDNASSNLQTQIDGKLSTSLPQNAIFVGNTSNIATSLAAGTNGYVLTSVSGVPTWAAVSAGTPPGSDTLMIFNDGGSFGTDSGFSYDKTANTLTVPNLETATTIGSAYIHRVGGTDVALADGGTGASLSDPGADRIMFWDDSAGAVTWLTVGSRLSITDTTISASASEILVSNVDISSAEILNINSVPVELIPAPGSGMVIRVEDIVIKYTFDTAAYSGSTSLYVSYNGVLAAINNQPTTLITQTSDKIFFGATNVTGGSLADFSLTDNLPITIWQPTSNPTSGSGTLKVSISYRIIDFN